MQHIKALISDADGTLLDTIQLIRHGQFEAAKKYLAELGIPESDIPDYETYNTFLTQVVGGSTKNTTESTIRLLYQDFPHYLEQINFDELYNSLAPIQNDLAPKYVNAHQGLPQLLNMLSGMNIKLAIFSSGSAHHIVRNFGIALPQLGMQELHKDTSMTDDTKLKLFEQKFADTFTIPGFTVVTAEDTQKHKPAPDGLNLAMTRLGVDPSEVVVLGDHKVDMQAAKSAGVKHIVGISHGIDDEDTLRTHGALDVTASLGDVRALIQKYDQE